MLYTRCRKAAVTCGAVTEVLETVRRYYIGRRSCCRGGLYGFLSGNSGSIPGYRTSDGWPLLHINHTAIKECNLEVFVDEDLLGTEVDDLLRLT